MAKQSGLGDGLHVHGYWISGNIGSIGNLACPRNPLSVTGINSDANERVLGRADPQLDFSSWFDDVSGRAHSILSTLPTTDVIVTYLRGSTRGNPASSCVYKQLNYDPTLGSDGSLAMSVQAQGTAAVAQEWGVMLTAGEDTHTTGTSSASVDNGASSADGAACYLHIRGIEGTSVTVTVEDSANDSTWATLVAFTTVSNGSEPTAERVTVAGTVDRYLRFTSSGTFTDADIVVTVRRGESTDDVAYT